MVTAFSLASKPTSLRDTSFATMKSRLLRSSFPRVRVPDDHYLVLGDNRDNSGDYRLIGFVSRERVLGRAHSIAFSLDYEQFYVPRFERFFTDLP